LGKCIKRGMTNKLIRVLRKYDKKAIAVNRTYTNFTDKRRERNRDLNGEICELGFAYFFTGKMGFGPPGLRITKYEWLWVWDFGKNRLRNGIWTTFGLKNWIWIISPPPPSSQPSKKLRAKPLKSWKLRQHTDWNRQQLTMLTNHRLVLMPSNSQSHHGEID